MNYRYIKLCLYVCISNNDNNMKIVKSHFGQTKQVLLRENGQVEVLSYNDHSRLWELDYKTQGGTEEFEMQMFFSIK